MAINGAPAATARFSASFALATAADSLDVTVQAQVLALLVDLKTRLGLAMVFISHSLPVVAEVADREVVLYAGEAVEEGRTAAVFARPRHPYTATLLRSAPDESGRPPRPIEGTVPPPHDLPPGCVRPRCGLRIPACEAARRPCSRSAKPGARAAFAGGSCEPPRRGAGALPFVPHFAVRSLLGNADSCPRDARSAP